MQSHPWILKNAEWFLICWMTIIYIYGWQGTSIIMILNHGKSRFYGNAYHFTLIYPKMELKDTLSKYIQRDSMITLINIES